MVSYADAMRGRKDSPNRTSQKPNQPKESTSTLPLQQQQQHRRQQQQNHTEFPDKKLEPSANQRNQTTGSRSASTITKSAWGINSRSTNNPNIGTQNGAPTARPMMAWGNQQSKNSTSSTITNQLTTGRPPPPSKQAARENESHLNNTATNRLESTRTSIPPKAVGAWGNTSDSRRTTGDETKPISDSVKSSPKLVWGKQQGTSKTTSNSATAASTANGDNPKALSSETAWVKVPPSINNNADTVKNNKNKKAGVTQSAKMSNSEATSNPNQQIKDRRTNGTTKQKPNESGNHPKKQQSAPASSANQGATQASKKSKKPKPTLKSMCIGDLMGANQKGNDSRPSTRPSTSPLKTRLVAPPVNMNSLEDFPAMSSSSAVRTVASRTGSGDNKQSLSSQNQSLRIMKRGEPPPAKASGHKQQQTSSQPSPKKNKKNAPNGSAAGTAQGSMDPRHLASSFFGSLPTQSRFGEGDEHRLLRMVQGGNFVQKKGRQRLKPRSKKFSALKKKVLQERLKKWRDLHPEENNNGSKDAAIYSQKQESSHNESGTIASTIQTISSCSICVYNFTSMEELEDDDEYSEIVENIREMAEKFGDIDNIYVPRELDRDSKYPVFVKFKKSQDATAAQGCWDGLVIGGETLEAVLIPERTPEDSSESADNWPKSILEAESSRMSLEDAPNEEIGKGTPSLATIVLYNVLTEDDFDDEDCMKESMEDIETECKKFGNLLELSKADGTSGDVYAVYEGGADAVQGIADQLSKVMMGGALLSVAIVEQMPNRSDPTTFGLMLENILTEDDLEDEECMEESLHDIRQLAEHHGEVVDVSAKDGIVYVRYKGGRDVVEEAVSKFNGLCLGGVTIRASIAVDSGSEENDNEKTPCLFLRNLLTEDDMEDEECLEESLNDVRELAGKYGEVISLDVVNENGNGVIKLVYAGSHSMLDEAVQNFNGMVLGGQEVSAVTSQSTKVSASPGGNKIPQTSGETDGDGSTAVTNSSNTVPSGDMTRTPAAITTTPLATKDAKPLFSGDKIIPERFAECKRVPKIASSCGPREYANLVSDEQVKPLLTEMLQELMRLQNRAKEDKNAKARRRLVMGLREVARGIRAHKVKMVVMANNLDEYGVIDEKLQEIIDLAEKEDVPLFFEFTKRGLGKAIGKTIKIAVVGIQNADGAHQPFKKLITIARKM